MNVQNLEKTFNECLKCPLCNNLLGISIFSTLIILFCKHEINIRSIYAMSPGHYSLHYYFNYENGNILLSDEIITVDNFEIKNVIYEGGIVCIISELNDENSIIELNDRYLNPYDGNFVDNFKKLLLLI